MSIGAERTYQVGEWLVEGGLNRVSRPGEELRLEAKAMDVLLYLLAHAGDVVTTDELLSAVWPDRVVEQSTVHRRINQIRRALRDDQSPRQYIETIVKRGYRVIADVARVTDTTDAGVEKAGGVLIPPIMAYEGSGPFIFVCYSHKNRDQVYPEIARLNAYGSNIWYDEGIRPGSEWTADIARAARMCDHFLFFVTPDSVASQHCRRELAFAQNHRRRIVAVHLEPTQLPDELELQMGLTQAIRRYDLSDADYERKIDQALDTADYTATLSQTFDSATEPNLVHPVRTPEHQPSRWWLYSAFALFAAAFIGVVWWTRQQVPAVDDIAAAPEATLTSIAVMPFDDLSPGADQAWLTNGMAAELVDSLSRIEALHVPAGTSTAILKQQQADIRTIADRLDVGTVVTGSIRRDDDRINVVARWIAVDGERSLWSARFERNLDDVFAIQKEIAVGIAEAIRQELGIHDIEVAAMSKQRYQTTDVRAWELFRRGFALVLTTLPYEAAEGRELLLRALDYDPNYVAALASLAWADFDNPEARLEGARKVLTIEPANVLAHAILIEDSLTLWDFETAERLLDRASAANPSNSLLTIPAYHIYAGTGRLREALASAKRGARINPLSAGPHHFLGRGNLNVGDYAAAVQSFERAMSLGGGMGDFWQAHAFMRNDQPSEALEAMVQGFPQYEQIIREGWQQGRWRGMNLALAESLVDYPSAQLAYIGEAVKVSLLAAAGERDAMYTILESFLEATRIVKRRDRETYRKVQFLSKAINAYSALKPYRGEARFQALKARLDARVAEAAGTYPYVPPGVEM